MKDQTKAYIFAIIAVIIWSTVASAFKISLGYVDHIQLLFIASLTSVIVLFIILVVQGKLKLLKSYTWEDYVLSALLGFINPFVYYLVLFGAYSLLPAQEAQPLNYTWPIVLVVISFVFLRQKIGWRGFAAVGMGFVGVIIIFTHGKPWALELSSVWGVILALLSAFIWATFWTLNLKDKRDEVAKLFLNFAFGMVPITIAFVLFSDIRIAPPQGWAALVYVGLFEMGVTFVLWLMALKLSKTTAQISILIYLSPFLSLVFIALIVGEKILLSTCVGLAFIIAGILVQKVDPKWFKGVMGKK